MKKFRGFTLTELMIALSVIGILTAVVTPAVMRIRPNKNKMMIKKAYYTTENIVSNLLNDANFYEDMSDNNDGTFLGFDVLNETKVQGNTISENSDKKFAELFMSRLNSKNCQYDDNYTGDYKICTTTDGMTWYIPKTKFGETNYPPANGNNYGSTTIFIDVNGSSNTPNCRQNGKNYAGADCTGDADDFDTFAIEIKEDGRMNISTADVKASGYIEIDTKVTD